MNRPARRTTLDYAPIERRSRSDPWPDWVHLLIAVAFFAAVLSAIPLVFVLIHVLFN